MEAPMTLTDAQVASFEAQGKAQGTQTSAPETLTDEQVSQFDQGQPTTGAMQTFKAPDEDPYEDVPFQPSPANPYQRMLLSFADRPEGKAVIAENLGLDVGGFREDGKMMIKNHRTGSYVPVTPDANGFTDFMRDAAGRLAEFIPDSMGIVTSIAGDIAGAPAGPGGAVAGGIAGAAVGEAAKQGVESYLTGQNEMSAGEIAGAGVGAGVGYGLFGLGKAALKGAGNQIYKILAKAGPAADELTQMVTSKPKNFAETFRNLVKAGVHPDDIVNATFKEDSFLSEVPRNTFFGGRKEALTLPNFVRTFKRNIGASPNKEVVRDLYKNTFGLSDEAISALEKRPMSDLLDKNKTSDRSLIQLGHQIKQDLQIGYKNLQHEYDVVYANIAKLGKDKVAAPIEIPVQSFLKTLEDTGIIIKSAGRTTSIGGKQVTLPGIKDTYFFNPNYSDKSALGHYKSLMRNFMAIGEDGTIYAKDLEKMSVGQLMKVLKNSQVTLDRVMDPTSNIPRVDKRPMTMFVDDLRKLVDAKVDYQPLRDINAKYKQFMNGKQLFDDASQQGIAGELGMLDTMNKLMAVKNPKNIIGNEEAMALRDAVTTMDSYMPSGKKVLPRISDTMASRELQVAQSEFPTATDQFTKLLDHSIQKESQESSIKHSIISSWDMALPNSSHFVVDAQKHLLSKTFLDSGSLWTSRWLGFMIGSLFGGGSSAIGKLRNVGIGLFAAKPSTWSKHVLPLVARAEAGMPTGYAQNPFIQSARRNLNTLGRRAMAQGGMAAGKAFSEPSDQ